MNMERYMSLPLLKQEKKEICAKTETAHSLIKEALSITDKWYVSCSFGKDSLVLLHLVLENDPKIPVVFINSQYCFPDTYKLRDHIQKQWKINLIELKQEIDYMYLTEQFGFSCDRTPSQQKNMVKKLKKNVMNKFAQDNDFAGCFWGLRAEESAGRNNFFKHKGNVFRAGNGLYRCSPIWDWTWEEIWRYVKFNNLPYNDIYMKDKILDKKQIRNSSWLTMDGASRGFCVWLKYYYPELFNKLSRKFPQIRNYV